VISFLTKSFELLHQQNCYLLISTKKHDHKEFSKDMSYHMLKYDPSLNSNKNGQLIFRPKQLCNIHDFLNSVKLLPISYFYLRDFLFRLL